jgi:uncharacterized membrane protein YfcA
LFIDWLLTADLSVSGFVFLSVLSFVTSAISATFGLGGGVLLLVVMSYFMPTATLIPVHGAVQLGSNTARAIVQWAHVFWPVFLPMLAGGIIGSWFGAVVTVSLDESLLRLMMGMVIIILVWLPKQGGRRMGRAGLFVSGGFINFLSMIVGASGPLTGTVLLRVLDKRHAMVATQAVFQTAQHLLKVIAFGFAGFAFAPWAGLIVVMLVTGFAGTIAGSRVLAGGSERWFQVVFRIIITVLAIDLVRRGVTGLL